MEAEQSKCGLSESEIKRMKYNINFYLQKLDTARDKGTQFYDACIIAKRALFELELLVKSK